MSFFLSLPFLVTVPVLSCFKKNLCVIGDIPKNLIAVSISYWWQSVEVTDEEVYSSEMTICILHWQEFHYTPWLNKFLSQGNCFHFDFLHSSQRPEKSLISRTYKFLQTSVHTASQKSLYFVCFSFSSCTVCTQLKTFITSHTHKINMKYLFPL